MKAASVAVALLSAAGALAQSSQLTINTPLSPVVCEPLLITWSGGTPPYFLSLLPGNQPSAPAVLDFGQQTGTSITWLVNQTVGASFGLDLRDSTGTLAQSAPFTIQSGSTTSCLNSGSSAGASGSTSSGSTTAGTTTPVTTPATTPANTNTATTPANTPTTPATTGAGAPSSKSGSSSSSAPSTSTTAKSGAVSVQTSGLVAAVGVAVLALVMA